MRLSRSNHLCAIAGLLVAWLFIWAPPALAQNRRSLQSRAYRGRVPVKVICQLAGNEFLNQATFTINSKLPAKTEREFELRLYLAGYGKQICVRRFVTFPQGATTLNCTMTYPQISPGFYWDLGLRESGVDLREKDNSRAFNRSLTWTSFENQSNASTLANCGVIVAPEQRKTITRELERLAGDSNVKFSNYLYYSILPFDEVPSAWRDLFIRNSWCIDFASLKAWGKSSPDGVRRLSTYVQAGGHLVIFGVQNSDERLAAASLLNGKQLTDAEAVIGLINEPKDRWWQQRPISNLELSALEEELTELERAALGIASDDAYTANVVNKDKQAVEQALRDKKNALIQEARRDTGESLRLDGVLFDAALAADTYWYGVVQSPLETLTRFGKTLSPSQSQFSDFSEPESLTSVNEFRRKTIQAVDPDKLYLFQHGLGQVHLFPDNLQQMDVAQKNQFLDLLRKSNTTSAMAANQDGNWTFRNLVKAVGKPPVWTFCVAVAGFSLVLGPGLLFLTGKLKRRSLMMLFVPAVSLGATICILVYNIFYEGFDSYSRVVSLQLIDENSDHGFCWSRQNYFFGQPKRGGLQFDDELLVRSVVTGWSRYRSYPNEIDRSEWTITVGDENLTWSGWLKTREQQQIMVGHAIDKPSVPIRVTQHDRDSINISNLTEQTLPIVVIRGSGDDYYWVEDLGPGQSVVAKSTDRLAAGNNISKALVDKLPDVPAELRRSSTLMSNLVTDSDFSIGTQPSDIISRVLASHFSDRLAIGTNGYATILSKSDNVIYPIEVSTPTDRDSTHLIIGKLTW